MDSKIVFVALILIAAFAITTLGTSEKDYISVETVRAILKKSNVNVMPSEGVINALTGKTVISNVDFEDLFKNVDHGVNGLYECGERCLNRPCYSARIGCYCRMTNFCYRNSLDM